MLGLPFEPDIIHTNLVRQESQVNSRGYSVCSLAFPKKSKTTNIASACSRSGLRNSPAPDTACWSRPRLAPAWGLNDDAYVHHGAEIVPTAQEVYGRADMIVKVKEPQAVECKMLRPGQIVFTYFHLAADRKLTEDLLQTGSIAVAYETLSDEHGRLPLLTPMSEVAGRMSIQEGAKYLERPQMGRGILLGGVPGVEPAHITILEAAWSAPMQPESPPASAPTSACWTSTWTASGTSTTSCRPT